MSLAQNIMLLDVLPSDGMTKIGACVILVILGVACLWQLHVPRRDRGGFR